MFINNKRQKNFSVVPSKVWVLFSDRVPNERNPERIKTAFRKEDGKVVTR